MNSYFTHDVKKRVTDLTKNQLKELLKRKVYLSFLWQLKI